MPNKERVCLAEAGKGRFNRSHGVRWKGSGETARREKEQQVIVYRLQEHARHWLWHIISILR